MLLLNFSLCSIFMNGMRVYIKTTSSIQKKEFCANEIGLGVQAWINFFYEEHLINQAFKLRLALEKKAKLAFFGR